MTRAFKIFFILFVVSSTGVAQIIPFKNYTVREGLPSNSINDIIQDKKGYMWLATDIGLAKFDGYNFKTLTIEDGLSDNYVNCLTLDDDGNIWAGTESGGISVINDFEITTYGDKQGVITEPIDIIFKDNQNRIWACGRQQGISVIAHDSIFTISEDNDIIKSNVSAYHVDKSGTIWLGTDNGVIYFDTTFHKLEQAVFQDIIVWDIINDAHGDIWIATENKGIIVYGDQGIKHYSEDNGLSTNITLSLLEDEKGRILVGTYYGGIQVIENGLVKQDYFKTTEEYWIWELIEDSRGRIWGRTYENGVLLINQKEVTQYSEENNLINNIPLQILEDSFGNIWIPTIEGVSVYGKVVFENFREGFVENDQHILSILVDQDNSILAGSSNGLTIFKDGKAVKTYSNENGLPETPTVQRIIKGDKNDFWLATTHLSHFVNGEIINMPINGLSNEGLTIIDLLENDDQIFGATEIGLIKYNKLNQECKILTKKDGLIYNSLFSIAVDPGGNIWCGTSSGLSILSNNVFYNYSVADGLPNEFINDICFDQQGIAWLATDLGICSLKILSDKSIETKVYDVSNGLASNSIISIIADKKDNIWLGHNVGVDKLNKHTDKFTNYSIAEGFLPIENNLGAIATDKDENIWFGTVDGIVKYTPGNDLPLKNPPLVYITNIKLYNDSTSINKYFSDVDSSNGLPLDLKLHHSKKNLYFDFVGLHYTNVEKNTYSYRLLGYEEDWSLPTNKIQSIPYQKLPHGKYTFQVKAANSDGVWTEQPADFSFEILAPFWKRWWFRVIEIITVVLLLWAFIYLRERKLVQDKKNLTLKVEERTKEISLQKDKIEAQHDEIVRQKKEITDSIHYAQHIQSAVLPKDESISPLLKDYFILYKPRDIVSGDFYWINGTENIAVVIAADCTGHGVPGAFMSMLGVSILNEIVTINEKTSSDKILNDLRDHIITTLSHTGAGQEAHDGMDLSLCIIDFKHMKIQFSGAYNPLVLIRKGEIEVFKGDKMPVGSHGGELKPFTSAVVPIQKGDCLYMYSDGYADQFGGPVGKKFKTSNFRSKLLEVSTLSMEDQKTELQNTLENWMEGYEQLDDILVMGIKI